MRPDVYQSLKELRIIASLTAANDNTPHMRLYIAILSLVLQQQCSLLNPETARSQAEQALKPYFPHAHAIVAGNMLLGVTCADLGPAAIQEFPATLDRNKSVQQLKSFG